MADQTEMQKATKELIAALNEAAEFHPQLMANTDEETQKRYEELSARVQRADRQWLKIFRRE